MTRQAVILALTLFSIGCDQTRDAVDGVQLDQASGVAFERIEYERLGCGPWGCPRYTISIEPDGHVVYRSFHPEDENIEPPGVIPASLLNHLVQSIRDPEVSLHGSHTSDSGVVVFDGVEFRLSLWHDGEQEPIVHEGTLSEAAYPVWQVVATIELIAELTGLETVSAVED